MIELGSGNYAERENTVRETHRIVLSLRRSVVENV